MSGNYEENLEMRLMRYASEHGETTMYSHLRTGRAAAYKLPEIMERMIYALAKEKADLKQMILDAANNSNEAKK